MAEPFLSEVRIFSFGFAPNGWAFCDGQLLRIDQNQALFALLGTTYGGDGRTNFALPNLQGQVPLHTGNGFALGQTAGEESHTLLAAELPAHTHPAEGSANAATSASPINAVLATTSANVYASAPLGSTYVPLNPLSVTNVGGSQAHENRQPFLTLNFAIALVGIFPSRN